jgi:hypothetical protein
MKITIDGTDYIGVTPEQFSQFEVDARELEQLRKLVNALTVSYRPYASDGENLAVRIEELRFAFEKALQEMTGCDLTVEIQVHQWTPRKTRDLARQAKLAGWSHTKWGRYAQKHSRPYIGVQEPKYRHISIYYEIGKVRHENHN